MKKLALIIGFIACLCLAFPVNAFAAEEFKDGEYNITFTVPDGWERNKDAENVQDRCFLHKTGTVSEYIVIRIMDMYESIEKSGNSNIKRNEIKNSAYSKEEIAEVFSSEGTATAETETETVGNYEYYKLSMTQEGNTNAVVYIHIYNGYAYFFRCENTGAPADDESLKSLMQTVNFTDEKGENKIKASSAKENSSFAKKVIIASAILFVIGVVGYLITKRRTDNKEQQMLDKS